MRIVRHISFIILVTALLAASATIEYFNADIPQDAQNEIHLEWKMSEDSALRAFEIKRKMSHDNEFARLTEVDIHPAQVNPRVYNYIDRNVFNSSANSEPVLYEIYGITSNGNRISLGQAEVNYTSTGIRRTWGSIKSMFQ